MLNTPDGIAAKISAARKARNHLLIIARTDAAASEGIDSAISRSKLYMEAGVDIIFPGALKTKEEMQKFNDAIHAPTLANMTEFDKTPYLKAEEFEQLDFMLIIWP